MSSAVLSCMHYNCTEFLSPSMQAEFFHSQKDKIKKALSPTSSPSHSSDDAEGASPFPSSSFQQLTDNTTESDNEE